MKQNLNTMAKTLGFDDNASTSQNPQQTPSSGRQQNEANKPDLAPNTSTSTARPPDGLPHTAASSTSSPGQKSSIPSQPENENAGASNSKTGKEMYWPQYAKDHTQGPWDAFKKKLAHTWRPVRVMPPRGSVCVDGMVVVDAPLAVITLDVRAWWNPKTKKIDYKSTYVSLRTTRAKVQRPLR
jgi:hypothetical protein